MQRNKFAALALAALVLTAAGCKKTSSTAASQPAKHYTTIDWANSGTIEGTIHFSGKAPERIPIDMGQDPVCSLSPTNLTEQYVVNNGGLANVVSVTNGLGDNAYAPPSTPVVMDQKGCRFCAHVIGVMAGQPVQFTNSDGTMHNVHMTPTLGTNQAVDVSEAPNAPGESRTLSTPEAMIPVRCNNHPWMEGYINVVSNPFYAVSDNTGHFVIKGLPPGTYTLTTNHEQMGAQTATVTVAAHQTATANFTYQQK